MTTSRYPTKQRDLIATFNMFNKEGSFDVHSGTISRILQLEWKNFVRRGNVLNTHEWTSDSLGRSPFNFSAKYFAISDGLYCQIECALIFESVIT